MQIFLVGGAVRDRLLGKAIRERDWVVTGATTQQMLDLGYQQQDPAFPVFTHPHTGEEYALARREHKQGRGHKGFVLEFGPDVTLEEDLGRRDLTINAIAQHTQGALIDPHGGRRDLTQRLLRHVSEAFCEDPLRVLRLARFAAELDAFGFRVVPATATIAVLMSADDDLLTLSPGRIWREAERALSSPAPQRFFLLLREFGALPQLMPWLVSASDPGAQAAITALERASAVDADPMVRLATLLTAAEHVGGAEGLPPASWPLPRLARILATMCIKHPIPRHVNVDDTMRWLEATDAWRRGDRFAQAMRIWAAVLPDQKESLPLLQQARDASAQVGPPSPGGDPRHEVREARRARVRDVLDSHGAPD